MISENSGTDWREIILVRGQPSLKVCAYESAALSQLRSEFPLLSASASSLLISTQTSKGLGFLKSFLPFPPSRMAAAPLKSFCPSGGLISRNPRFLLSKRGVLSGVGRRCGFSCGVVMWRGNHLLPSGYPSRAQSVLTRKINVWATGTKVGSEEQREEAFGSNNNIGFCGKM